MAVRLAAGVEAEHRHRHHFVAVQRQQRLQHRRQPITAISGSVVECDDTIRRARLTLPFVLARSSRQMLASAGSMPVVDGYLGNYLKSVFSFVV